MMRCQVPDLKYTGKEVEEAVKNDRLLSLEIELSEGGLSDKEICDAVLQAKRLGAKKLLIFGELSESRVSDLIRFASEQGLEADISDYKISEAGERVKQHTSLPENKCLRPLISCLVTSQGDVLPCAGLSIPIGNIREHKLCDILKDSEVLEDIKAIPSMIKGPCRACEEADVCLGCRGAAYQLTGDYLASDPLCPKNASRQSEIIRLPVRVDDIIPQKTPMRVVDRLTRIAERTAEVSATISDDLPFAGEDGRLDEVLCMELVAQSAAAFNGFKHLGISGATPEGYLLGARKFEISGTVNVGDTLNISVYKYARYGDFGIVKGTVSRDGDVIARGEIKIWHRSS
ncbi:SPASM domain-containing protein [Desulfococcaceae bacterium HSG8]|nr:SPASM domain-containing protein [Desulfococcaceae bacterium HSG8]